MEVFDVIEPIVIPVNPVTPVKIPPQAHLTHNLTNA